MSGEFVIEARNPKTPRDNWYAIWHGSWYVDDTAEQGAEGVRLLAECVQNETWEGVEYRLVYRLMK